jgi:hypothetical protein
VVEKEMEREGYTWNILGSMWRIECDGEGLSEAYALPRRHK